MIGIKTLQEILKLEIDDFSDNVEKSQELESLHRFVNDYAERFRLPILTVSAFPANLDGIKTDSLTGEHHEHS